MNREHHRWYSHRTGRDMELLVFGHGGMPLLVFPSSMGAFFEYEDRGMIGALHDRYDGGHLQAFCVTSVDKSSWYNKGIHPADRAKVHAGYDDYIYSEVLPLIRQKNGSAKVCATGCSFGGYHAMNFALKHPDAVSHCVSMSGAFDIRNFVNGYYDPNVYFNNPVDFLPNMGDPWYLDQYRSMKWVLATAEWDICLDDNWRMAGIFSRKGIPHWLDVWGPGLKHDWPLWQQMSHKYFR